MEKHGHKAVGWCEKDKFAQKSYKAIHNTEGEWFNADVTTVQSGELPEADVYCGGFPCQSFSIAGEWGGFDDMRGTLIFEILRLAKERQPKYLFLENVKGLLSHDRGKTFAAILNAIHECGYEYTEWQVLNSKNFGVPQNRERVFIIGHLRGESTRKVFPIRRKNKGTIKRHQVDSSGKGYKSKNDRLYQTDGLMCCLPTKQTASKTKIIQKGLNTTEEGDSYCIDSNYHKGTSPGDINSGRRTHIKIIDDYNQNYTELFGAVRQTNANKALRNGVKLQIGTRIRKLTPKECWRLQGFPDWAFEKAKEVNSDTQLYRQAGNSVTIPVIYEIAKRLK